jgi:hypothetical protein
MKSFAIALGLLLLVAATAAASERAVSSKTLDHMGLGSMVQLSDADGMAIRGKGPYDSRFLSFAPRTGDSFPTFRGPSRFYGAPFPTSGGTGGLGGTLPSGFNLDLGSFVGQLGM